MLLIGPPAKVLAWSIFLFENSRFVIGIQHKLFEFEFSLLIITFEAGDTTRIT